MISCILRVSFLLQRQPPEEFPAVVLAMAFHLSAVIFYRFRHALRRGHWGEVFATVYLHFGLKNGRNA